jgi:hypothetical protein
MQIHPAIHAELARQRHAALIAEARTSRAGRKEQGCEQRWRRLARRPWFTRPPADVAYEEGEIRWSCT